MLLHKHFSRYCMSLHDKFIYPVLQPDIKAFFNYIWVAKTMLLLWLQTICSMDAFQLPLNQAQVSLFSYCGIVHVMWGVTTGSREEATAEKWASHDHNWKHLWKLLKFSESQFPHLNSTFTVGQSMVNMFTEDIAAMPHVVQDHIIMLGHEELERESKTWTKHYSIMPRSVYSYIYSINIRHLLFKGRSLSEI